MNHQDKQHRVVNFSAGPAIIAQEALQEAQDHLVNYKGNGLSVMEMSHRSKEFEDILNTTKETIIKLYAIPDTYDVLFIQGGASLQFAMAPMNLATKDQSIDLIQSGSWTKKAAKEIQKLAKLNIVASSEPDNFLKLPTFSDADFSDDAAYVHMCSNNTIYGTQFKQFPKTASPLVCDMSSDILSRPITVEDFGIIYAGAQKNLGPAGVAVVIIRKDLIQKAPKELPSMLQYRTYSDNNSLYNTPPTFGIYMIGLTTSWLLKQGGLDAMYQANEEKAALLYNALEENPLFDIPVPKADRSSMNVVFTLKNPNEALEKELVSQAKKEGFINLKGHRSIGGFRCSIYNAMPLSGIRAFIEFTHQFSKTAV